MSVEIQAPEAPSLNYFDKALDLTDDPPPKLQVSGTFEQRASYYLQQLGALLKAPAFVLTEKAFRYFGPVHPNMFDQSSRFQEYAGRSLLVALLILAMIPAPGTVGIGAVCALGSVAGAALLGCTLKLVARWIDRRDFLHLQVGEPLQFAEDQLTVVSANICAIEAGLGYICGGVLPFAQRIDRIVAALTMSTGPKKPDVLMLQEVWSLRAAHALANQLSHLGYCEFYFSIGDSGISPGAALFVASRHKLENPQVEHFTGIGAFDMQRCFFSVELPHREGAERKVHLMTAHPAPSADDLEPSQSEKEVRQAQLCQLFKRIGLLDRLVLAGDFNMMPNELKSVLEKQGPEALAVQGDLHKATCTQNLGNTYLSKPLAEDVRLDYIITQNLSKATAVESLIPLYEEAEMVDGERSINTQTALSDHHALKLLIQV